ncbi:MAG: flavin reductase domain protein FMN-binding [Caulobacteraceae bacterium]|nr:flavin reductase domain protein FMN-binding [Caulobacteraceae bacterium]
MPPSAHQPVASVRDFVGAARFREAMARLAGGVSIVACLDRGEPRGLLVSSLTSLSTDPPRLLFCVRQLASTHDPLLRADRCSLSVLTEDDVDEAERFSRPDPAGARFTTPGWRIPEGGPPRFDSALISVCGSISRRIDAGSHSIFILDVEAVESRDAGPLVYFDRGYAAVDRLGFPRIRPPASRPDQSPARRPARRRAAGVAPPR